MKLLLQVSTILKDISLKHYHFLRGRPTVMKLYVSVSESLRTPDQDLPDNSRRTAQ
jgi:hypothetical protein